jgi:hypothetical protein
MSEHEEHGKGFKVTDRRSFTREGEPIERTEVEAEKTPEEVDPRIPGHATEAARGPEVRARESRSRSAPGHLEGRFLDLLSLLATQASFALGAPHPATGEVREDLETARVMISLIEVLGDKTKGNLTREEQAAVDEVLYQLRMDFMVKAKLIKT